MTTPLTELDNDALKALAKEHGVDSRYGRDKLIAALTDKIGAELPAPEDDTEPEAEPADEETPAPETEPSEAPEPEAQDEPSEDETPAEEAPEPEPVTETDFTAAAEEASAVADTVVEELAEDKNASNQSGGTWNTGYGPLPYQGTVIGADGRRHPITD